MLALILGSALALAAVLGARRAARALWRSAEPVLPLYRNDVAGTSRAVLRFADPADLARVDLTVTSSANGSLDAISAPPTPVLSPVLADDDGASMRCRDVR